MSGWGGGFPGVSGESRKPKANESQDKAADADAASADASEPDPEEQDSEE